MTTLTLKLLNSFAPCYSPEEIGFMDGLSLTPVEFIDQFRDKVKDKEDIIWVLLRTKFLSDKELRLFAVWCARISLLNIKNPDKISIEAVNVAELFSIGKATMDELFAAYSAADSAAYSAAYVAASSAADFAADISADF